MAPVEILFFDYPIPAAVPGFLPAYPTALFPCLGSFCFLDCGIANTGFADSSCRHILIRKEHQKPQMLLNRGEKEICTPLAAGIESEKTVTEFLRRQKGKKVILYNLTSVCLLHGDLLLEKALQCGQEMIRLSVDYLPSDIYIAPSEYFLAILEQKLHFMENLFTEILPSSCDLMEEVEGKVILFSNIADFMKIHLELITLKNSEKFMENLLKISMIVKQEDASISESGEVRNSVIFSGTKIDGFVDNSFIFPGVHIGESASVSNSVIMNGHKIGKHASITNTLLLPCFDDTFTGSTIGSETVLGKNSSNASNRSFPKQITQGLTVIGTNVKIPRKVIVEPGCYIGSNTDEGAFSGRIKITRGSTVKPVGHKGI